MIHQFLAASYWARDIPLELVRRSIENSLCFGIYDGGEQLAFARVITDYATFGYVSDVFVVPSHRGRGLSKWLMEEIRAHPELQALRRWHLLTADAQALYKQFGFTELSKPEMHMEITVPDAYRRK